MHFTTYLYYFQTVLERISFGLNHRQWLVRIGTMHVTRMVLEHQCVLSNFEVNFIMRN